VDLTLGKNSKMQHKFLVMWNRDGLQYVGDQTRIDGEQIWDRIRCAESHWYPDVMHLRTIAQRQPHLHFEIWEFITDPGITEDHIKQIFKQNPQKSADLVRSLGQCLYSDRMVTEAKIT
jgi:hypothetical protein